MPTRLLAVVLGLVAANAFAESSCVPPGKWVTPGTPPRPLDAPALLQSTAKRRVVLLGEAHDRAEHHRWELQTLAELHAGGRDMVIGFEMFPRRVQPALDRWVAGELSESEFLAASDWKNVWGLEPQLYLPLFHFARMNRIPMLALNVDQALVRAVRDKGFDAVPDAEREGVMRPAAPSSAYVDSLYAIFLQHEEKASEKPARDSVAFRRFVEAQTLWDGAMAQAIARARPAALVVAIAGMEHVARRHGIPHQLDALGVTDVAVLLPWDSDADCADLRAGLANAVFGVAAPRASEAKRPRLGVRIEAAQGGVRIAAVEPASIAEAAGLRAGDVVVAIAGRPAQQAGDVAEAVARQAPGTWLPLRVQRDGQLLDLVARFPPLAN